MIEFYRFSGDLHLALTMAAIICVIIQCLTLIISGYRYRLGRIQAIESLLEGLALAQIVLLSLMMAHVQTSAAGVNMILSSQYIAGRYSLFLAIASVSALLCAHRKNPRLLVLAAVSAMTLPLVEGLFGRLFPAVYIFVLVFWAVRGIFRCISLWREIRSSISALSIKEAIDALKTGILFCDRYGYIMLENHKMRSLMSELTGDVHKDANEFYALLERGQVRRGCEKVELDRHMVYRLPDGSAWMFTDSEILIKNKAYRQISATDVTGQWDTAVQLGRQNIALQKRSGELKKSIENMKRICSEEEVLRAKSRIHDVLGQRVAMLMRSMREQTQPDAELLNAFKNGLPEELKSPPSDTEAQQRLKALADVFRRIGVTVSLSGELPESQTAARFFTEIITEAVTNAVRHGFSSVVSVTCGETPKNWTMIIEDNGMVNNEEFSEGGGIGNMRRRLADVRGNLQIQTTPNFVLRVKLPKGELYDKNTYS